MNPSASLFWSLLAATTLALPLAAQEAEWLQDFAKAKAKAKAEQKDLLLDFTGSDWCTWCIKLDEEVFQQKEFRAEAPKHFVLVKLDFPNDEKLITEEIRKQNEELAEQFQIQGYPTIVLLDNSGRIYAQTGYREGGATDYNSHLAELKQAGADFQKAMQQADAGKGIDRAKALDTALAALDADLVTNHYGKLLEEICTLDADGKAGLKEKRAEQAAAAQAAAAARVAQLALQKEAKLLQEAITDLMENKEYDKAIAKLDEFIAKPKNKIQHQLALFFKGMVIMDAKEDAAAAITELEAARVLDPESPIAQQIDMILPQLKRLAKQQADK